MKRIVCVAVVMLILAGTGYGNQEMDVALPGGGSMAFVWIQPGTFLMGSSGTDKTRLGAEIPQHEVTISRGFWLGKYELTQRQWEAVMGANPSVYVSADRPVDSVSLNDVWGFVHRLNEAAGDSLYRLPSEAEWEYACRADTQTPWFFGEDDAVLGDYAWCAVGNGATDDYPVGTKPVGLKLPNPWGLFDMYGNVFEWCQSGYQPYTADSQVDPMAEDTGYGYAFRGGHFYGNSRGVRSAVRGYDLAVARRNWLGARLLRMEPTATSAASASWGHVKRAVPGERGR